MEVLIVPDNRYKISRNPPRDISIQVMVVEKSFEAFSLSLFAYLKNPVSSPNVSTT
jgi:hypothetical protein